MAAHPRIPRPTRPAGDGRRGDWLRPLGVLVVLGLALAGVTLAGSPHHPVRAAVATARRARPPAGLPPPTGVVLPRGPLARALEALQATYVRVVRAIEPAVVQITTAGDLGSGVILDRRGDIVTNAHVVGRSRRVTVTLADGRITTGTVVGTDRAEDLAVVRIHAGGLSPARFAGPGAVEPGAIVLAVGNPLGFQSSVSVGIVSAIGRRVTEPDGVTIADAVQTSAEINPGNSGGALVDLAGQVVGIPTLVALSQQQAGEAPGIGFAVPSRTVATVAAELVRGGAVGTTTPDLLGLTGGGVVTAAGAPAGVLVTDVSPASPAARAGLRPQEIVVAVAGRPTLTVAALAAALSRLRPGRAAAVTVLTPEGRRLQATVRAPRRRSR